MVDISNWTFANDLIQEYYRREYGINIKDAKLLVQFNVANGLETISEVAFDVKKDTSSKSLYTTVRAEFGAPIESYREKVKNPTNKRISKIDVSDYKEAYIDYDFYNTHIYAITSKGYKITIRIDLGVPKHDESEILEFVKQGM